MDVRQELQVPARTRGVAAAVLALAVVTTVLALATEQLPDARSWMLAALVAAGGVLSTELTIGIGRNRAADVGPLRSTALLSVWVFAGVLLLPPGLSAVLTWVLGLQLATRVLRRSGLPASYVVVNQAGLVLAAFAGTFVIEVSGTDPITGRGDLASLVVVLVVAAGYLAVRLGPSAVLVLSPSLGRAPFAALRPGDAVLESATVGVGAVIATVLVGPFPWAAVLILPALLLLGRGLLRLPDDPPVAPDPFADLVGAAVWMRGARRELRRAQRLRQAVGVLRVEFDDAGHADLAGGRLAAAAIARLTGRRGLVSRVGDGGLAVLLPASEADETGRVAAALLAATVPAGLDVSIGAVGYPVDGFDPDELLRAADRAVRLAQREGGARVVSSPAGEVDDGAICPVQRARSALTRRLAAPFSGARDS